MNPTMAHPGNGTPETSPPETSPGLTGRALGLPGLLVGGALGFLRTGVLWALLGGAAGYLLIARLTPGGFAPDGTPEGPLTQWGPWAALVALMIVAGVAAGVFGLLRTVRKTVGRAVVENVHLKTGTEALSGLVAPRLLDTLKSAGIETSRLDRFVAGTEDLPLDALRSAPTGAWQGLSGGVLTAVLDKLPLPPFLAIARGLLNIGRRGVSTFGFSLSELFDGLARRARSGPAGGPPTVSYAALRETLAEDARRRMWSFADDKLQFFQWLAAGLYGGLLLLAWWAVRSAA